MHNLRNARTKNVPWRSVPVHCEPLRFFRVLPSNDGQACFGNCRKATIDGKCQGQGTALAVVKKGPGYDLSASQSDRGGRHIVIRNLGGGVFCRLRYCVPHADSGSFADATMPCRAVVVSSHSPPRRYLRGHPLLVQAAAGTAVARLGPTAIKK